MIRNSSTISGGKSFGYGGLLVHHENRTLAGFLAAPGFLLGMSLGLVAD